MAILKQGSDRKISSLGALQTVVRKRNESSDDKVGKGSSSMKRTSRWQYLWKGLSHRSTGLDDSLDSSDNERQIYKIRRNSRKTRCSFNDFIAGLTQDDISNLKGLLESDCRQWKSITFQDFLHGNDYCTWYEKKNIIHRELLAVADEKDIDLKFEGFLEISFSDMSISSIIDLLADLQKDTTVQVLKFSGPLDYCDAHCLVTALETLLTSDNREWNVIFSASFGEESPANHYNKWVNAMKLAERRLGDIAIKNNIAIRMTTWKNKTW